MTDELVSLIKSSDKVVGTKQVIKAIMDGTLRCVIVSDDADGYMVDKVEKAAKSANVKVYHAASMVELGKVCGIEVAALTAGIKK